MQQWMIRIRGRDVGPVPSSTLASLAASGEVTQTTEIRLDGTERWVPASKVKGLVFGDPPLELDLSAPPPPRQPNPVVHTAVPPASFSPAPSASPTMRRCRFCAEEVLAAAVMCKHCGSSLTDTGTRAGSVPPRPTCAPELLNQRKFELVAGETMIMEGRWAYRKGVINTKIGDGYLTSHRFVFCAQSLAWMALLGPVLPEVARLAGYRAKKIDFQIATGQLESLTSKKFGLGTFLRLKTRSGEEYQCGPLTRREVWSDEIRRHCAGGEHAVRSAAIVGGRGGFGG